MKKACILFLTLISLYSYGQECGYFIPEWYLREINVNDQITNLTPNDEVVNEPYNVLKTLQEILSQHSVKQVLV